MRARFDSAYIRSELERIGQQLDNPLTVFLIGGGSMAFRGPKTGVATTDMRRIRSYHSSSSAA